MTSNAKQVKLTNVRLAFPALAEPEAVNDGSPRYGAVLLLETDSPSFAANKAAIEAAMEFAATEKWGAKGATVLESLKSSLKTCLRDGNTKAEYTGFAGNFFVTTSSQPSHPPALYAGHADPATGRPAKLLRDVEGGKAEIQRVFYAGCYVNVQIELWAQDNQYGKRVNAQLRGLQKAADGLPFGGGSVAEDTEFEVIADGDDIPF